MNVVVLAGTIAHPPELRTLGSGVTLLSLSLAVAGADGTTSSVPLVWADPPPEAGDLAVGDELVVLGEVRRRFFRTSGVTQSRTEVVVERLAAASDGRRRGRLLDEAAGRVRPPARAGRR